MEVNMNNLVEEDLMKQLSDLDEGISFLADVLTEKLCVDRDFVFDLYQRSEYNYAIYAWMRDHKDPTLQDVRDSRMYVWEVFKETYKKFSNMATERAPEKQRGLWDQ